MAVLLNLEEGCDAGVKLLSQGDGILDFRF
jgi:hypothetical protein